MHAMSLPRSLSPEQHSALSGRAGASPCSAAARPFVLAATILASAMAFIDGSVVTIALPVMQKEMAAGLAALQWVVNGYMLFLGALILVGGSAGDRFGRRRVFVLGTVGFAAASALCAVAPSLGWLIVARSAQGAFAAFMVPQSLAILSASFPADIRGHAIGTWAGASALTTAMGPAVGGVLIDALGWRAAFWINLPLAAGVVWLALRHVPESWSGDTAGPLDWRGAVLAVASAGLFTLGLSALAGEGGGWAAAGLCLAGVAAGAAFIAVERRAPAPVMPLGLFASRAFTGANLATLFLYGALSGMIFLLPFDLMGPRGLSASEVGFTLLPLGLIIGVFASRAGALADKIGARALLVTGSSVAAAAGVAFAIGLPGLAGTLGPVLLLGSGMTLVVAPLTTVVMNAAPDALSGAASGINNAVSRLAGLFAVALVGAATALVFAGALGSGVGDGHFGVWPAVGSAEYPVVLSAFSRAYGVGMSVSAALAALAAFTAWRMIPGRGDEPPHQDHGPDGTSPTQRDFKSYDRGVGGDQERRDMPR